MQNIMHELIQHQDQLIQNIWRKLDETLLQNLQNFYALYMSCIKFLEPTYS